MAESTPIDFILSSFAFLVNLGRHMGATNQTRWILGGRLDRPRSGESFIDFGTVELIGWPSLDTIATINPDGLIQY